MVKFLIKKYFELFWKYLLKVKYVHGKKSRLLIGQKVVTNNTIFNTVSGDIHIGDNTIFGLNCMVLTGKHEFEDGMRKYLKGYSSEVPENGNDIHIGNGCWIASGAIIIGPIRIEDNVIIGAGSVVTKDVPENVFVCGNPASIKSKHNNKNNK